MALAAQGKRRIDLEYEPPPPPELPAWVQRLGTAPGDDRSGVVDAKPEAVGFYEKLGFMMLEVVTRLPGSHSMFLALGSIPKPLRRDWPPWSAIRPGSARLGGGARPRLTSG